jgi:hypothetical protein
VAVLAISLIPDWPPSFTVTPFTLPGITAGLAYSGMIATNATDLNGDVITFAKVSGPAWLTIAGNGALSGTPLSSDVGLNTFGVSATDPGSLSGSATLNITVTPTPAIIAALSLSGTNVSLSWTGGIPPYQVQMTTNLPASAWQAVGDPTNATVLLLPAGDAAAFYRILGD